MSFFRLFKRNHKDVTGILPVETVSPFVSADDETPVVIRTGNWWGNGSAVPVPSASNVVRFSDVGLERLEDFRPGRASASTYRFPEGEEQDSKKQPPLSERIAINVVSNLGPQTSQPPTLETPAQRMARASSSLRYFLNDSIAGPALKTLYEYVIGPGFSVEIHYGFDELPPWFKATNPEVAVVKRNYQGQRASKDRDKLIFLDYIKYRMNELKDDLDLETFAIDCARDALVMGDAFGYRIDSLGNPDYAESWLNDMREYLENTIGEIQTLNPLAVTLTTDEFNAITEAQIVPIQSGGGTGPPTKIPDLDKLIRMKWGGTKYTVYGVPHMVNALTELTLKDSLIKAAKASADRFSVPVRMAKFGMPSSQAGPIATPQMRAEMSNALKNFNPETDTILAPFHWDIKLIGAEGEVIDLATQLAQSDRRVMEAMGIPPNFLDSNYTSFSTAKIQFANMILKLRQLQKSVARVLERDIFERYAMMRGYRAPDGSVLKIRVRWTRANLETDPEIIRLIGILARQSGQRILSRRTIRETLGFDTATEDQNFAIEDDEDVASGRSSSTQKAAPLSGEESLSESGYALEDTKTKAMLNRASYLEGLALAGDADALEELYDVVDELRRVVADLTSVNRD